VNGPGRAEDAILALAGQLDDLRGEVTELGARVDDWKREMGALMARAAAVEGLSKDVAVLRDQVGKLAARAARKPGKPGPEDSDTAPPVAVHWTAIAPSDQATMLAELAKWVDGFLRPNYAGYKLAACWSAHPEAIWELGGIWQEWLRVYEDEDDPDLAASLFWHDRWLPGALGRLERAIKCDEGGCQRRRPPAQPRS
jgi:hypothetical protein